VDWLLVGVGSFAGGVTRYVLGKAILGWAGGAFPWHTLTINLTGSLAIGVLGALLTRWGEPANAPLRLLLMVGVLGGYTTFSSYSLELLTLTQQGRWLAAATYGAVSTLLGLAVCAAGYGAALRFAPPS
jgi:fluoride exporter